MSPEPAHILISGRDESLLSTRGGVLRTAGYRVTTTLNPVSEVDSLEAVDLLVICHTLSADQRAQDLDALRRVNGHAQALCLVPHAGRLDPQSAVLNSFAGPVQMLHAVGRLVNSTCQK